MVHLISTIVSRFLNLLTFVFVVTIVLRVNNLNVIHLKFFFLFRHFGRDDCVEMDVEFDCIIWVLLRFSCASTAMSFIQCDDEFTEKND